MSDFYLLALHRVLQNNPRKLLQLMSHANSAEAVFLQSADMTKTLEDEVKQDLAWLAEPDHHLVTFKDADYPESLREIWDPPYLLFAQGDRTTLSWSRECVAMVGARKASAYGHKQAQSIAGALASTQVLVVSGLATGIDSASHEGCLIAGGRTIAVLGTGCDLIYPKRNWRLAERICASGLILSEFPLRTPALPYHFPRRNRIVTGICRATIVIEAALQSGSLVSARLAMSEGRDVMALPGLVTNPQSRGCHQLIRDGATLIESATDVLLELGLEGELSFQPVGSRHPLTPDQKQLLERLEQNPQSIDMLMCHLELPVEELTVNLLSLEVLGLVCLEGGRYQVTGVASL